VAAYLVVRLRAELERLSASKGKEEKEGEMIMDLGGLCVFLCLCFVCLKKKKCTGRPFLVLGTPPPPIACREEGGCSFQKKTFAAAFFGKTKKQKKIAEKIGKSGSDSKNKT
jgi:hypothetical protein